MYGSAIMSGMTAKEALRCVKRGFVIEWTGEEFVVVNFLLNPTRVKQRWTKDAASQPDTSFPHRSCPTVRSGKHSNGHNLKPPVVA
jgi:hypothetical protein